MPRARSIQIYLKEGIEEDERLLALWEACKRHDRPQVMFRRLLQEGMKSLMDKGEISNTLLERSGNLTFIPPKKTTKTDDLPRVSVETMEPYSEKPAKTKEQETVPINIETDRSADPPAEEDLQTEIAADQSPKVDTNIVSETPKEDAVQPVGNKKTELKQKYGNLM